MMAAAGEVEVIVGARKDARPLGCSVEVWRVVEGGIWDHSHVVDVMEGHCEWAILEAPVKQCDSRGIAG